MEENNSKEIILTQEGYDKLESELELLKTTRRKEVAERLKLLYPLVTFQKMLSMMKLRKNRQLLKKES